MTIFNYSLINNFIVVLWACIFLFILGACASNLGVTFKSYV